MRLISHHPPKPSEVFVDLQNPVLEPSWNDLLKAVNPPSTSGMASPFHPTSFWGSSSPGIVSNGICDHVHTLFCFNLTPNAPERSVHMIRRYRGFYRPWTLWPMRMRKNLMKIGTRGCWRNDATKESLLQSPSKMERSWWQPYLAHTTEFFLVQVLRRISGSSTCIIFEAVSTQIPPPAHIFEVFAAA